MVRPHVGGTTPKPGISALVGFDQPSLSRHRRLIGRVVRFPQLLDERISLRVMLNNDQRGFHYTVSASTLSYSSWAQKTDHPDPVPLLQFRSLPSLLPQATLQSIQTDICFPPGDARQHDRSVRPQAGLIHQFTRTVWIRLAGGRRCLTACNSHRRSGPCISARSLPEGMLAFARRHTIAIPLY